MTLGTFRAFHASCSNRHRNLFSLVQSRQFLSFLPNSNPLGTKNRKHEASKIVAFSPDFVFDVVADVDNYKKFLPFCVDSKVTEKINDKKILAEMAIGFKLFTERYTSEVVLDPPNKILVRAVNSPSFSSLESTWNFTKQGNNKCKIDFSVAFETANPITAATIDPFFQDLVKQQITAFSERFKLINKKIKSTNEITKILPSSAESTVIDEEEEEEEEEDEDVESQKILKDFQKAFQKKIMKSYNPHNSDVNTRNEQLISIQDFENLCDELSHKYNSFNSLLADPILLQAVFTVINAMIDRRVKGTEEGYRRTQLFLDLFVTHLYIMVEATPSARAIHLFHLIDRDDNKVLDRTELTQALTTYITTVGLVIPQIIQHHMINIQHEEKETLDTEESMQQALKLVRQMMRETIEDIPLAVDEIFEQIDVDESGGLSIDEWINAWHHYQEMLDLMSLNGMSKLVQWASVIEEKKASIPS